MSAIELITPNTILGGLLGTFGTWFFLSIHKWRHRRKAAYWDVRDPANQSRFVREGDFFTKAPINAESFKTVFSVVEKQLNREFPGYRILAEVNLGAFLKTKVDTHGKRNDRAFRSINSKRVDFLIIDRFGNPALAIEYHGTFKRTDGQLSSDEVKRLVFCKVSLPVIEVPALTESREVARLVRVGIARGN